MEQNENIEKMKMIKEHWKEDYFISLGIYQHLVECKQKFDAVKNSAIISDFTKEQLQFELDKELADLKILLDMYVKQEMFSKRINKFIEKMKK